MTLNIKFDGETNVSFWFIVNEKYSVRIDKKTKEGSCECLADVFKKGGRKQKNCKHIKKAIEFLKEMKKL